MTITPMCAWHSARHPSSNPLVAEWRVRGKKGRSIEAVDAAHCGIVRAAGPLQSQAHRQRRQGDVRMCVVTFATT
jgi:hypothetical protein